jgi:integrase
VCAQKVSGYHNARTVLTRHARTYRARRADLLGLSRRRFPADPPPVEEIIAVMRVTGSGPDGARLRALIVVLWRAGLRISEALDLAETDLDRPRGAVVVRAGKRGRRR